jgi:hypothetical protein
MRRGALRPRARAFRFQVVLLLANCAEAYAADTYQVRAADRRSRNLKASAAGEFLKLALLGKMCLGAAELKEPRSWASSAVAVA